MMEEPDPYAFPLFSEEMPSRVAKRRFERELPKILSGWRRRIRKANRLAELSNDGSGSDEVEFVEGADNWMLRHIYRLVRHLRKKGHEGVLPELINKWRVRQGGLHDIDAQPFKQALLLMASGEFGPCPPMTRQRRSELGDAMEYAYRHKVPAKYVSGFIRQAGQKQCRAKLLAGYVEPGFEIE